MKNSDLIAFIKPIQSHFNSSGTVELVDITGRVSGIEASSCRLAMRLRLSAGLYCGHVETLRAAFDMSTAMIDMVRVPGGERVAVGPWDLDHLHNVMAMPMARTIVNGKLKGGLWFSMPGPEQIAEGQLSADFGFEAEEGENEVVLEFVEHDRERMQWGKLASLELRKDDRRKVPLLPAGSGGYRIFFRDADLPALRDRWQSTPEFAALCEMLRRKELVLLSDNSQGTLELAGFAYALTGDAELGARAKVRVMDLAYAKTWSGRPDPLLMGGDNDRGISLRLYHLALGWRLLQPLLDDAERDAIQKKAEEYIGKIYDFTLLQRGYMGCPAIDPHSLGAWNGVAIASMAFCDDLPIARQALPFFHGLFVDSLQLFPASGKAAWATYFPFHLILYLAAAETFAGAQPEVATSPFLDHLGEALLASFEGPNSQEMQRGLRTREHRFLTAFLCRFHRTPEIESIYRAFVQREREAAGDVMLGLFDLLYAPASAGPIATFPDRPLFARDVGDVVATVRTDRTLSVSLNGGPKAGRAAVFHLMPQNREFAPSMGAFEVWVDGAPVLTNINISAYGLNSALTNAMCFEDGGAVTNGQYLNGAVRPEANAVVRRCLIDDRFLYVHIVIAASLDPKLKVREADRVFVLDRRSGSIVISDAFAGDEPIRFATHLHCSGSITELGGQRFRLTGGQANLIAGMKGGSKGLNDAERGETFVSVLRTSSPARVVTEEPAWIPGYIYGLNYTGKEELRDGHFPRYRRWRLEATAPTAGASFLFALALQPNAVAMIDHTVTLPDGAEMQLGPASMRALDVECDCECLLADRFTGRLTALGLRVLRHDDRELAFAAPVDITYSVEDGSGVIYAERRLPPAICGGFRIEAWQPIGDEQWRTHNTFRAGIGVAQAVSRSEETDS